MNPFDEMAAAFGRRIAPQSWPVIYDDIEVDDGDSAAEPLGPEHPAAEEGDVEF